MAQQYGRQQEAVVAYPPPPQSYPAVEGYPPPGHQYVAAPPQAGYPAPMMMDSSKDQQHATNYQTRGDGFWKGCCAALCCCCVLDACF